MVSKVVVPDADSWAFARFMRARYRTRTSSSTVRIACDACCEEDGPGCGRDVRRKVLVAAAIAMTACGRHSSPDRNLAPDWMLFSRTRARS
jgi:hypothetical protein